MNAVASSVQEVGIPLVTVWNREKAGFYKISPIITQESLLIKKQILNSFSLASEVFYMKW